MRTLRLVRRGLASLAWIAALILAGWIGYYLGYGDAQQDALNQTHVTPVDFSHPSR